MRRDRPGDPPVSGLTREIGLRIESMDADSIDGGARDVVAGLVALTLEAASGAAGSGPAPSESDPLALATGLAAAARARGAPVAGVDLMDLAVPVVAASLATATCHPGSGALLGASILAGCELGLLLAEMAGVGADAPLAPLAATCAAAAGGRVLDLRGDRLVSAIGIGASSSVGAAVRADVSWQAGRSASNGVLAALLAGACFTGPPDVLEHPRGLLGAVVGVDPQVGTTARFAHRIGALEPLVNSALPAGELDEKATGLWEMERGSDLLAALIPDRGRR